MMLRVLLPGVVFRGPSAGAARALRLGVAHGRECARSLPAGGANRRLLSGGGAIQARPGLAARRDGGVGAVALSSPLDALGFSGAGRYSRAPIFMSRGGKRPCSSSPRPNPAPESEAPVDGLTRYPTMSSHQGILRGVDLFGTGVFALSGCVTAGNSGMDMLGCMIVGTITAMGGGTVRDILIGVRPVFWFVEYEYLLLCLATTFWTFHTWSLLVEQGIREDHEILNWADALGIGAFCVIGAQNAARVGLHPAVCVVSSMITSTFGGVMRDVLCQRKPRILHSQAEVYASNAILGGITFVTLRQLGFSPLTRVVAGFIAGAGSRVLSWKYGIRLPDWFQTPHTPRDEPLDVLDMDSDEIHAVYDEAHPITPYDLH